MISILIPTYKSVDYLELALESILKNQFYEQNEVVVVVDGTFEIVKNVLEAYKKLLNLKVVVFDENKGFAFALNYGFFNSSFPLVLAINDDNVMPKNFDKILLSHESTHTIITPNQIEPRPSIFQPFIIHNFGENTTEFNLDEFTEKEQLFRINQIGLGWTFPFFCSKEMFLSLGGFDVLYPGNHVSDWDFFVKAEKNGIRLNRIYDCNFYHFGSKSARTHESYQQELDAHAFFEYKWGFKAYNRLL